MNQNTLSIELQPKQNKLLGLIEDSPYSIIGFGGSNGGAKSHAIREISLILALKYPKINILIFRRLSNDLLENHIIPLFMSHPEFREYFNKTEKILYLPNLSMVNFGYAQREDDIYSFQGKEYDIIFIDEATHSSQVMIEFLRTRNRSKVFPKAKMIMTMNPGNISHAYIKRLFIDKTYLENEDPSDYVFLPAKIYDNVIWSQAALREKGHTVKEYYNNWTEEQRKEFTLQHSDYAKALSKLPEQLRLAYLEGDWDVFGGMFFRGFNKKWQVIEPFRIPAEWRIVGSVDPGYSSPCAFGLGTVDFKRNYYHIATYYFSNRNPEEHAKAIQEYFWGEKSPIRLLLRDRRPEFIVSGKDAWAKQDRFAIVASEKTFSDVFSEHGLHLIPATTDRIPGWWAVKSLIPDRFYIFDDFNAHLIDEISAAVSDDKVVEDLKGRGNDPDVSDHALDMLRYLIMSIDKNLQIKEETPYAWLRKLQKDQKKQTEGFMAR